MQQTAASDKWCKRAFSVICSLYFIVGIALVSIGSKHFNKNEQETYAAVLGVSSFRWYMLATAFLCGLLVLISGVIGCVGVWLKTKGNQKNRCCIYAFIIIQSLLLIIGLIAVLLTVFYLRRMQTEEFEQAAAKIKEFYGLNGTDNGVTDAMDAMQRRAKCCGWSAGEGNANIFMDTPWYRIIASGDSDEEQEPDLYPASCCTDSAIRSKESLEQCVRAQVEPEARLNGFMNKLDCVDKIIEKNRVYSWVALGLTVFSLCLLIPLFVLAILLLKGLRSQPAEGQNEQAIPLQGVR